MRILNFGSLNIDNVYSLPHFVQPGETISSTAYKQHCGGKGLNQSIAAAKAGADVFHAGMVGADGQMLLDEMKSAGVDTTYVKTVDCASGHAVIQVDSNGENSIILFGGANTAITAGYAEQVLANFGAEDMLLLQNEISAMPDIMRLAKKRGMKIAFNPAPMHPMVLDYPLELVDIFIVNEIEAAQLAGESNFTEDSEVLAALQRRYNNAMVVQTLGSRGVACVCDGQTFSAAAQKVRAVDTTAAGDTFIGYLLTALLEGMDIGQALELGCAASAICVTRKGAAGAIPMRSELV